MLASCPEVATGGFIANAATGFDPLERMMSRSAFFVAAAVALVAGLAFSSNAGAAPDVDAAKALARQNNCFKCHSVEKEKDGPAWKKVAEKYKDKSDAEARLIQHITSGEKAKFPDGHEEEHKIVQTSPPDDKAQIKNLVDWILSL
jgi:cytochrome c